MKRKKEIKFPKKKVSEHRPQIEILDPKKRPFDLDKTGQYSEHWKRAAEAAKIDPPGGRP